MPTGNDREAPSEATVEEDTTKTATGSIGDASGNRIVHMVLRDR